MSTGTVLWVLGGWLAAGGLFLAGQARSSQLRHREYREKVGLDLPALIALLPVELQNRRYHRFSVGPRRSPDVICVALLYAVDLPFRGTPPNVGLEFDRRDGSFVRVVPDGIGLGVK